MQLTYSYLPIVPLIYYCYWPVVNAYISLLLMPIIDFPYDNVNAYCIIDLPPIAIACCFYVDLNAQPMKKWR